jgi:flagellar FliL protein
MKADSAASGDVDGGARKKKLVVIIIVALLAVTAGAGVTWFLARGNSSSAGPKQAAAPKAAKLEPPVFVPIEPFTVNLQQENGEQFLQTAFTLQVNGTEEAENIKANMPQVRSRLLLLLSSKRASELASTEGKKALSDEIIKLVNEPFAQYAPPQQVTGVFFTSFIVQ